MGPVPGGYGLWAAEQKTDEAVYMEHGAHIGVAELRDVGRDVSMDGIRAREMGPRGRFQSAAECLIQSAQVRLDPVESIVSQSLPATEPLIRLLDIVGSLAILVVALPVMLVCALLIKLTSPGPVLYKQDRVGKGGRVFTLYKFRTMIKDAEKHIGPVWAKKDDHRVTPVGRILRRLRVDELPQAINILRGDMSLVGPRPERPYFVAQHKALQGVRLAVKPGLTGLAQVRSFYDLKPDHKMKYDHLYIQNRSLLLNLYILLQTIPVLFTKKGW